MIFMIPNVIVLVFQNHNSSVERDQKYDHGVVGILGVGRAGGGRGAGA